MSENNQSFAAELAGEAKNLCPVCGAHWADHDFGIPHPICPQAPLPGQSWSNPPPTTETP